MAVVVMVVVMVPTMTEDTMAMATRTRITKDYPHSSRNLPSTASRHFHNEFFIYCSPSTPFVRILHRHHSVRFASFRVFVAFCRVFFDFWLLFVTLTPDCDKATTITMSRCTQNLFTQRHYVGFFFTSSFFFTIVFCISLFFSRVSLEYSMNTYLDPWTLELNLSRYTVTAMNLKASGK